MSCLRATYLEPAARRGSSPSADCREAASRAWRSALAPHLGVFPGAVHVRSDVERKRLFGVGAEERLPRAPMRAEVSDIVYTMCRKRALMALEGGHSVIVDAVHAKQEERDAIAEIAARGRRRLHRAFGSTRRAETMRQRIAARTGDVSDATPAVLDEQLGYDLGQQTFAVIDAGRPLDEVVASCLERIGAPSRLGPARRAPIHPLLTLSPDSRVEAGCASCSPAARSGLDGVGTLGRVSQACARARGGEAAFGAWPPFRRLRLLHPASADRLCRRKPRRAAAPAEMARSSASA